MGTGPTWVHANTFTAEPVSVGRARAFVCARLIEHRLWHLVDPVRVVASELATSAMMHGSPSFTLTLSAADEAVILSLRPDGGTVPTQRLSPESALSGPGLVIVEVLSRDWGVTTDADGGRGLWASFPAQARPAPEGPRRTRS
jgi:hypothetical protein